MLLKKEKNNKDNQPVWHREILINMRENNSNLKQNNVQNMQQCNYVTMDFYEQKLSKNCKGINCKKKTEHTC